MIEPQVTQAALAGLLGSLGRRVGRQDLVHQVHIVANRRDCLAHEFFGAPVAVHLRRVDQREAQLHTPA